MKLSIREVLDLSERCFSAAGFAAGPARANAESIWWTEAYRGTGLETLHGLLETLPGLDRTELSLRNRSPNVAVVDNADQPVVVSSTPAVDLACARAKRQGTGVTYTTLDDGDETLSTLGHVAHRAAERGCVAVVLSTGGRRGSTTVVGTPDDPYPLVAELDLPAPSVSYVELHDVVTAGLHDRRHAPLTQAFFKGGEDPEHDVAEKRLLNRLLHRATEPARGRRADVEAGYVTICLDPDHSVHSAHATGLGSQFERFVDEGEATFTTVHRPGAIRDRVETLLNDGVDVDRDVWRDIFDYSSEILAPPFEGSHRGAGFEINE